MKAYRDANAFRQALEEHLRQSTPTNVGRVRKRLAMERLLVRLQADEPLRWILKGGLALELRLRDRARATKDIDVGVDLELAGGRESGLALVAEELRLAAERDARDYFRFVIPSGESDLEIEPEPPRDLRRVFEAEALRTGLGPVSLEMADSRLQRLWNDLGLKEK